jgi:hypothetical protein
MVKRGADASPSARWAGKLPVLNLYLLNDSLLSDCPGLISMSIRRKPFLPSLDLGDCNAFGQCDR